MNAISGLASWAVRRPARFSLKHDRPGIVAIATVLLIYVLRYLGHRRDVVDGDGHYSWIYAHSLAFDFDLKLENDYAVCGDKWGVADVFIPGRPVNPFYLGPALLWAPLLRLLAFLKHHSAEVRASCGLEYSGAVLWIAPFTGIAALVLGYRFARRWFASEACAFGVLVVGLCSPVMQFATAQPTYSHVYAALGVALGLWLWVRAFEQREGDTPLHRRLRFLLAGLGFGVAALMRTQQAVLMLCPAGVLLLEMIVGIRRGRARQALTNGVIEGLLVLLGFLAVFQIQLFTNKYLWGHWWVIPQGKVYLQLGHAHPVLMLFSARSGLFYWHPLTWFCAIGLALLGLSRRTRALGLLLLVPTMVEIWVSSAVLDWHGGATLGCRRMVGLAAIGIVAAAASYQALAAFLSRRPWRWRAFAVVSFLTFWVLESHGISYTPRGETAIVYDKPIPAHELYGTTLRHSVANIERYLGNPFVLPVSVPFALRYGVSPRHFDLVDDGLFCRRYRPPHEVWNSDTLDLADALVQKRMIEGFAVGQAGAPEIARKARMTFDLCWHWVTDLEVTAEPVASKQPVEVEIVVGRFFSRRRACTITVPAAGGVVKTAVDRKAFDSGINELIFETRAPVRISKLRFIDTKTYDATMW